MEYAVQCNQEYFLCFLGVNFDFGLLLSEYKSLDAKLPDNVLCVDSLSMLRDIDEQMETKTTSPTNKEECNSDSILSNSFNKIKRKLIFPSENSTNSTGTQSNHGNLLNCKKSSLFDPIEYDSTAYNKVPKEDCTVSNKIPQHDSTTSNNVPETSEETKKSSQDNVHCTASGKAEQSQEETQEYNVEEYGFGGRDSDKPSLVKNNTVNPNDSRYPGVLSGACNIPGDDDDLRSVSPGLIAAINTMVNTGDFDDDEDTFCEDNWNKESKSRDDITHSNHVHISKTEDTFYQNESNQQSKSNDSVTHANHAHTCENGMSPVSITGATLSKHIEETGTVSEEMTQKEGPCDLGDGDNGKNSNDVPSSACVSPPPVQRKCDNIIRNSPVSEQQNPSNFQINSTEAEIGLVSPGKSVISDRKDSPPSKPQSPWYTPTRLGDSPFKKYKYSYKLTDVHKRVLGWSPKNAHTAEDDCMSLLRICQKLCPQVCQWADENAVPIEKIPPLYSKSPRKRKPLPEGVFPYCS